MSKATVTMFETRGVICFEAGGSEYLHLGKHQDVLVGAPLKFANEAMLEACRVRNYKEALMATHEASLLTLEFPLADLDIQTRGHISPAPQVVTKTNCRDEEGITVGLLDGMIAMARILAKRNLAPVAVQEALKDFTADEDVKFVMNAVQDWEFGEETQVVIPVEEPVVMDVATILPWRLEVKFHTWPMGWDKDIIEKRFGTREEVDQYISEQQEWSLSEDNKVHIQVFHNDRPYSTRQFG